MIKIVIADDHEIVRNGLRNLLDDEADISVIGEAENGRGAIKLSDELNPDIILMDLSMHDLNGIDATKQIKKDNPKIHVIALSMHSERHIVINAFKAGVSGYVLKDSSHIELVKAIRTIHLGHRYLPIEISDIVVQELSSGLNGKTTMGACPLSSRENEILQLLAEGKSIGDIASDLYISPKTVASHRANIMDKLNIHNLPLLTKYAIGAGLTSVEF